MKRIFTLQYGVNPFLIWIFIIQIGEKTVVRRNKKKLKMNQEIEFTHLGFEKLFYTQNRKSIVDLFVQNNRCGIYILHFANGEYYVGQTVNIVQRFAQHKVKYTDINYLSFREVTKTKLTEIEREIVHQFELLNKRLRNISIVSIVNGETDLDLIVSIEDQAKWLNYELPLDTLNTERFEYAELRKKYTHNYEKLKKNPLFDEICEILQNYVAYTIPYPRATEYYFWSCSCLPSNNNRGALGRGILVRFNVYWQEVLNMVNDEVFYEEDGLEKTENVITITIFLSKTKLFEHYTQAELEKKYSSLEFGEQVYASGGQDQQQIFIDDYEFLDFLYDKPISDAIKHFNLRLMRKGSCNNNRYHSFDLADEAVRTDNIDLSLSSEKKTPSV